MTHKEKAMKIFYEKFNCSQAVLGAYADDYGLTVDQAMKVAESGSMFQRGREKR